MKKIILSFWAVAGIMLGEMNAHNYAEGDSMTVVATSGLRLRMMPDMHARTIHVLEFGDQVTVMDTYGFSEKHADRVGWMDGHWVKVQYDNLVGYAFDGFLSTLTIPTHENQLCIDCADITFPFDRYLIENYPSEGISEGPQHGEDISQFVTRHQGAIVSTKTSGTGWFQFEATFEGRRLCEVINLLRSMMVDKHLRKSFEDSLVFFENATGHVHKVEVRMYDKPIRLEVEDGVIKVASMVFTATDGC